MEEERKGTDLGHFIRQQREKSSVSLRKLAERAGISNPYLSQIERGLRKPSADILKALARALSISAESLYVRAGLLEERDQNLTVVEAIQNDLALTARQKDSLVEIYRTFSRAGDLQEEA